ncbi:DUF222 domain-containing protein [Microbacterium sp. PMB16]|uniref:HNH endonuclease signature motif containing protein n=1 Tax=Microbacterium sp. PMB16 TaxID=3120157 RepID=UPI003F4C753D
MNSTSDIFDQVVPDLREVLRADSIRLSTDAEKMDLLRVAGEMQRLVDALVVETVASAHPEFARAFGCVSMNELVQRVLRTDAAGAGRVVRAAKVVHRETELTTGAPLPAWWPQMREALLDGVVGVAGLLAATGPVDQAGRRVSPEDRLRADAALAAFARGVAEDVDPGVDADADADADADPGSEAAPPATPEDLRFRAQLIVAYLDPDGAKPAEDVAMRTRGVTLGREKDGVIPIRGHLLPEVAGQLKSGWDAYLNPKVDGPPMPGVAFRPSEGCGPAEKDRESTGQEPGDDSTLPAGDSSGLIDTRTRAQKQHDALAAMLGIAARHDEMPRLGGAAPTLLVTVTAEDYATGRGWAHVQGVDTPVSVGVAQHTACGGSVQRVLFDPEGRIIGIGSTDRIFTVHQRRAITQRDRECLIPGCHVPASWCEIHHVTEHARGGPTHTDNGVTLCWHHHRTLDDSGWEIRMQNGIPEVRGPGWWDPHRRWRTPPHLLAGIRRRAG